MGIEQVNTIKCDSQKRERRGKGIIAATVASSAVAGLSIPVTTAFMYGLQKSATKYSDDEIKIINNAAHKVINEETNLNSKGVKINDYRDNKPAQKISFIDELKNQFKTIKKQIKKKQVSIIKDIKEGKNACFIPSINSVLINMEKLAPSVFHELGHAYNFNNSKLFKSMQIARTPLMGLSLITLLYSIFTRKSRPKHEDGELNKAQKFNNFLRKTSPILAAGAFVPIIIEEGVATYRGYKWTNKLVNPKLSKKILKTNLYGLGTYVTLAVFTGLSALAGRVVKDKMQKDI